MNQRKGRKKRMKNKCSGAIKHDNIKPATDLLPSYALIKISEVLSYGANKYERHNWRLGMKWSRMYGAALRHLFAWNDGENVDSETGKSHLAHAACCILFLLQYEKDHTDLDDRFKGV